MRAFSAGVRRHQRSCLIAAGAAGLSGFADCQHASAGLTIDLRAVALSSSLGQISSDGKSVTQVAAGDVVTFSVYARVSGTNGVNDEHAKSSFGSIHSLGALLGNISGGVVQPFAAGQTNYNGTVVDFDSDGDLDIGTAGTAAAGKFNPRSGSPTPASTLVGPQAGEVQIGHFIYMLLNEGASSQLSYIKRPGATAATWFEDSSLTAKNPSNGIYSAGAPIVVTAVPEPSALGLMTLAGAGLLRRAREVDEPREL